MDFIATPPSDVPTISPSGRGISPTGTSRAGVDCVKAISERLATPPVHSDTRRTKVIRWLPRLLPFP